MSTYTYTPSNIAAFTMNGLDMMTVKTAAATAFATFSLTALESNWGDFTKLVVHLDNFIATAKGNDTLVDVTITNGEYLPDTVVTEFKTLAAKYKKNVKFTVSLLPDADSKKPVVVTY